jgi:hypothetical protein
MPWIVNGTEGKSIPEIGKRLRARLCFLCVDYILLIGPLLHSETGLVLGLDWMNRKKSHDEAQNSPIFF